VGAPSLAPDQKKARQTRALVVFLDESGFSEAPSVRRTWSPRGCTPILVTPFNWKRASAIASLITTPAARRVGLCLRLHGGTIKQPQVIAYLRALKQHVGDRKVVLLWDRLPAHRGGDVQRHLARQASWLTVEYLPPYVSPAPTWRNSSVTISKPSAAESAEPLPRSDVATISAKPSSNTAVSSNNANVTTF
jgi:hypothetical protein